MYWMFYCCIMLTFVCITKVPKAYFNTIQNEYT